MPRMNVRATALVILLLVVVSAAQEKSKNPKKPKKISTKKRVELLAEALAAMAKVQAERHDEVIDLLKKDDSCLNTTTNTPTTEAPAACPQPTTSSLGEAACDVTTEGGPWTIVQRRTVGDVLFNVSWDTYQRGFGAQGGDYWIGNDALNELCPPGRACLVRFEFTYPGEPYDSAVPRQPSGRYGAQYGQFSVAGPEDYYRLAIGQYDSTASTASDNMMGSYTLNGMAFSTNDADHDTWGFGNCASRGSGGGWWYRDCHYACLNGAWALDSSRGVHWKDVTGSNSATSSLIMVRVAA